jgi:hypothetical protein
MIRRLVGKPISRKLRFGMAWNQTGLDRSLRIRCRRVLRKPALRRDVILAVGHCDRKEVIRELPCGLWPGVT